MPISKNKLNDALEDWGAANLIRLLVVNEEFAGCFRSVRDADRSTKHPLSAYYRVMTAANEILAGAGVEYHNGCYYVNMLNSSDNTFIYNENNHKYEVGSMEYISKQVKTW